MGARAIARVCSLGSLDLEDSSARAEAGLHALHGAGARDRLHGQRTISTLVALITDAGAVVARTMVRAGVGTGGHVAEVASPARLAVASSAGGARLPHWELKALALAVTHLPIDYRAALVASKPEPVVVTPALAVVAEAVVGAVLWASAHAAVWAMEAFMAEAGDVLAPAVLGAVIQAGGHLAVGPDIALVAVAGAVGAGATVSAVLLAGALRTVDTLPARKALAALVIQADALARAQPWALALGAVVVRVPRPAHALTLDAVAVVGAVVGALGHRAVLA